MQKRSLVSLLLGILLVTACTSSPTAETPADSEVTETPQTGTADQDTADTNVNATAEDQSITGSTTAEPGTDQPENTGLSTYTLQDYGMSLQYPSSWMPVSDGSDSNSSYKGADGFFQVGVITFDETTNIDQAAQKEVEQILSPYGSTPTITKTTIAGQQARWITPSSDQEAEMNQQSALIILAPVDGYKMNTVTTGNYIIIWADAGHIQSIADTVNFSQSDIK